MIESSRSISQAVGSQPRRIDRRVRRTQAALQKSLIEVAGEKDYSAITTDDLTNDLAQQNAPLAPGSLVTRGEVALNMFATPSKIGRPTVS